MEIVQWLLTHGSEVELIISWYDTNVELTMYTHSNRRVCRKTIGCYEIENYTNEAITLILDLMYEELNLGGNN